MKLNNFCSRLLISYNCVVCSFVRSLVRWLVQSFVVPTPSCVCLSFIIVVRVVRVR